MKKAGTLIENLYKHAVSGIFYPIALALTIAAGLTTCYVNMEIQVRTYYVSDNLSTNLLATVAVVAVSFLLMKIKPVKDFTDRVNSDEHYFLALRRALVISIIAVAAIWVLATGYLPEYDQMYLQDAVYSLHIGENRIFSPGEYIDKYPHQLGLMWIYYLISLVAGVRNYTCIQLLNAIFLGVFYGELSEICRKLKMTNLTSLMVVFIGLLFFPAVIYCSYIYGNIIGLSLAVLAVRHEFEFFENHKIKNAIAASLFIALAVCVKSNYLIFMIGMVIFAVVKICKKQKAVYLLLPLLMTITYIAQAKLPLAAAQQLTGQPLDEGSSILSWVAMGLHNDEKNPGWYDYYNWDSYDEIGFDKQKQAEASCKDIEKSIEYYSERPDVLLEFLTEKILSQWNNPDYQCFWTFCNTATAGSPAQWTQVVMSSRGVNLGTQLANIIQFIILAGAVLYFVLCRKDEKFTDSLIFAMIFIGGFLFHIMWEAKAQYVLSFFLLLIPYCAAGYSRLVNNLINAGKAENRIPLKQIVLSPALWLTFATVAALAGIYGGKADYLTEDNNAYAQYMQAKETHRPVNDGRYAFTTEKGYVLSHSIKDGYFVPVVHLTDTADETSYLLLKNHQQDTWLRFTASNTMLSYTEDGTESRQTVMAIENELRDSQKWTVEAAGDGMVHIRYQKNYLTYDEETMEVYTAPYSGMENQIWNVNKL